MENKRGGAREGAGRKKGKPNSSNTSLKNKNFLNYRYTEEEVNKMKEAINEYKTKNRCTTSKAIMDLILGN